MRVLALVSGGKDSCYCILQCIAAGHEIVALGNIKPAPGTDEMDSYMYQSVGHEVIELYAEAMNLPLFQQETKGQSINKNRSYEPSVNDEVEDLYQLLIKAKEEIHFDAVSSGAILSNYQRIRVENICSRLDLVSLAYLWQRDQKELLEEMISSHIKAIVIKTASLGLEPVKALGVDISNLLAYFSMLNEKYQLNICGEGGEYETLTLDCPIFKKRIEILDEEIVWVTKDDFAPVAYLKIKEAKLIDKRVDASVDLKQIIEDYRIKKPVDFIDEFDLSPGKTKTKSEKLVQPPPFDFDGIKQQVSITKTNLWLTGLIGRGNSIRESTNDVMQQVSSAMRANDLTMKNIIKISVYIKSLADYAEFNAVYKEYFSANPPVRACVQVLLPSDVFFLMDCQATLGYANTLHVQSISNWAPANIGPYSQGVLNENLIYTSGQIALVPGSMDLIEGNSDVQSNLILRHISRVLSALRENVDLKHIIVGICYTTDEFVADLIGNFMANVNIEFEPLLIPVLVANLPRNADIEWQVIAKIDIDKIKLNRRDLEIENGVIKIATCETDCDRFILLKYFMNDEKGKLSLDDFENGLKRVGKHVDAGFVQLFCTDENYIEFYNSVNNCFTDCSVSVVPVIRFERLDCRLIVFLHGSK